MGTKYAWVTGIGALTVACLPICGCWHAGQDHGRQIRATPPPEPKPPPPESRHQNSPPIGQCADEPDTRSPADKLLDLSIAKDDLDGVRTAVAQGATLDDGAALLAAEGHPPTFRFLKSRGAKEPTLLQAIDAGSVATVERLLAAGVKPREDASGHDPLTVAASEADLRTDVRRKIVTLLLAHGANARTSDAFNRAADCVDESEDGEENVDRCDPELMRIFIRNGAVVDRTTLFYGFRYRDSIRTQMLDVLFSARIAPTQVAEALAGAESPQRLALITRIVKKIGTENLPIGDAAKQLDVELLRAMFDAGARADGARGEAALADVFDLLKGPGSEASVADVNAVLELLLAHGANPKRRVGEVPLAIAKSRGDARTVELLVKAGAQEPPSTTSQVASPARAPVREWRTKDFRDPWLPRPNPRDRF